MLRRRLTWALGLDTVTTPDQSTPDRPDVTTSKAAGISVPFSAIKEHGPMAYAFLVAALYVCGFLVLNSHLAKHGIGDYEFVDARYFLAGASYAFLLVCFYLFAGRAVLHMPRWLQEDINHYQKLGLSSRWVVVVFLHSLVSLTFGCCLSAALFSLTAFGDVETAFFYAVLAGAFFVLYSFDVANLDIRFPRTHLVVSFVVKALAVVSFFANPDTGMLMAVFFMFIGLVVFINLSLDSLTRHGITRDRVTFSAIYAVLLVLLTAVAYGGIAFGNVTPKIGGARPQTVVAALSQETLESIPKDLACSPGNQLVGQLIHQTELFTYIEVSGKTVRLRSGDIVALVVSPEIPKAFWAEYIKKTASAANMSTNTSINTDAAR